MSVDLIKQLVDHWVRETLIGGRKAGDMVVDGQTAMEIDQFKALLAAKLREASGGTQTLASVLAEGNDANGLKITNAADPDADQDVATKKYVDDNGGGSSYLVASVDVTDAEFKNLDSVGITLIAAPGVGKAIMITSWAISKKFAAGAYGGTGAGANGLQMYIEGTGDTISREIVIVASSGTDEFYGGINTGPSGDPYNWFNSVVENKAVELWSNLSNDMTGGNAANTLKVTVYYVVVDL